MAKFIRNDSVKRIRKKQQKRLLFTKYLHYTTPHYSSQLSHKALTENLNGGTLFQLSTCPNYIIALFQIYTALDLTSGLYYDCNITATLPTISFAINGIAYTLTARDYMIPVSVSLLL